MGKAPLFVRPPTDAERQALEDGLRSPDAFVLRRAQIILASAQGEQVGVIAPAAASAGRPSALSSGPLMPRACPPCANARAGTASSKGASIRQARSRCVLCCTAGHAPVTS